MISIAHPCQAPVGLFSNVAAFWQRPDAVTRSGIVQPFYDHHPGEEAERLAEEWAPLVTQGARNLGRAPVGPAPKTFGAYRRPYWGRR